MAVDKKSQHVGNHGGTYIDNDGQTKQFTYIDYDKKAKASSYVANSEEIEAIKAQRAVYNERLIRSLLALPAVKLAGAADDYYEFLLIRNRETGISWNEKAVHDLVMNGDSFFLLTLLWRRTVKEVHWFDPIFMNDDVEALERGEWRALM